MWGGGREGPTCRTLLNYAFKAGAYIVIGCHNITEALNCCCKMMDAFDLRKKIQALVQNFAVYRAY